MQYNSIKFQVKDDSIYNIYYSIAMGFVGCVCVCVSDEFIIHCYYYRIKIQFRTVIVCNDEEFPATNKCDPITIEFVIEDSVPTGTLLQFELNPFL